MSFGNFPSLAFLMHVQTRDQKTNLKITSMLLGRRHQDTCTSTGTIPADDDGQQYYGMIWA